MKLNKEREGMLLIDFVMRTGNGGILSSFHYWGREGVRKKRWSGLGDLKQVT